MWYIFLTTVVAASSLHVTMTVSGTPRPLVTDCEAKIP